MPDTRNWLLGAMFLILYLLLLVPLALAREQDHTCQGGHNCNEGGEVQGQDQTQEQANSQDQVQEQANSQDQGQDQTQDQSSSSMSEGSSANVSISSGHSGKTRKIKNTPDPNAPPIYPTVPCFKGGSASLTLPGFGASAGGGKIDEGCNEREWIRIAPTVTLRLFMYCQAEFVQARFLTVEDCLSQTDPEPPLPLPPPPVVSDDEPVGLMRNVHMVAQVTEAQAEDIVVRKTRGLDRQVEELMRQQRATHGRQERILQQQQQQQQDQQRRDSDYRIWRTDAERVLKRSSE